MCGYFFSDYGIVLISGGTYLMIGDNQTVVWVSERFNV